MTKKPNKSLPKISPTDWYDSMYRHLRRNPMAPRDCGYCLDTFSPSRPNDKDSKFCSKECRIAFHQYGGLPMRVLLRPVEAQMRAVVKSKLGLRKLITEEIGKQTAEARKRDEEWIRGLVSQMLAEVETDGASGESVIENMVLAEVAKSAMPMTLKEISKALEIKAKNLAPVVSGLLASGELEGAAGAYRVPLEPSTEAAS